jgi:hypothetical protein
LAVDDWPPFLPDDVEDLPAEWLMFALTVVDLDNGDVADFRTALLDKETA